MADPPDPRPPGSGPPARPERSLPLPARLLGGGARGARRVAQAAGVDRTVEAVTEEAIVRAIESAAVERALVRVLQGPAVEEAMEGALNSPAVERALVEALDSELVDTVWRRLLASDEAQRLVERIAEAPEVRSAIAAQGVGFLDDLRRQVALVARRLDRAVENVVRRILFRPRRSEPSDRAGIVSRGAALAVDLGLLNAAFLAISAVVALVASALVPGSDLAPALAFGVGVWLVAGGLYLFAFWTLAAQTPGMRFLAIRLDAVGTARVDARVAIRRLVGVVAATIPLGLGFLSILTSERRRGLQDRIGRTEVAYEPLGREAPWSEPDPAGTPGAAP